MPNYNYKARDNSGKLVKGVIEAASKDEVAEKLKRMGYAPIDIAEALMGVSLEKLSKGLRRISTEEIVMFDLQLANMLNSGLSIMSSLDTLKKQVENRKLKEIIDNVARSVEGGLSLSQSFAQYPGVFSRLFISMVAAGEASGNLDQVLNRYAEFAEAQEDLRQKIRAALFYPAILIVAATLVIVFIVTFVIPKFVEIFQRAGIAMPAATILLYHLGNFIKQFWYLMILAIGLIGVGFKAYIKTTAGRIKIDRLSLKLPVIGPLVRKTCISRFARTLSTLIASGVPILQSLDIVRDVVDNEVLGQVIYQMRMAAEKGEKLSESLKVSAEFPPDTVQMISVGEESGNLEGMLNKISDFYDRAINYSIKKITTVLEPVFLVIMGAIVAFIMASMLLPMFDMIKLLRR
ncbi:MAG: type II secretion system F family protein [Candidatus Omnitrophica bacterium]|nr:type II secretion system F family protein [Candidatus Omnitrophota bacterium]